MQQVVVVMVMMVVDRVNITLLLFIYYACWFCHPVAKTHPFPVVWQHRGNARSDDLMR